MSKALWKEFLLSEITSDLKDGTHGTHKRVTEGIPLLSAKNISPQGKVIWDKNDDQISEQEYKDITAHFSPRVGDLLLTIVGTLGRSAIFEGERVAFQRSVAFIRPNNAVHPKFLFYTSQSAAFSGQLWRRCNITAQAGLYLGEIAKLRVSLPNAPIQKKISAILEAIDAEIEQTEALIVKWQKLKAGMMQDLFTRGVTPDGRLRPSYAEAPILYKESPLGWIPKEWYPIALQKISSLITSGSRGWAEYYAESGPLFIRIGNLTREHVNFRWDNVVRVDLPKHTEGQRTAIQANDVLISITADLGIVGVAREDLGEAYINQHIALVRLKNAHHLSRFVGNYLTTNAVQKQFLKLNDSGAKAGLNLPAVGKITIALPNDENEALAISKKIDACDCRIEALKRSGAKLKLKKHGLMHDLLTGHVRVSVHDDKKDAA